MMTRCLSTAAAFLTLLLGASSAVASDIEEKAWVESELTLPAFPQDADLIEFDISATTPNRFFIDGRTLSVGSDGVVRYVLVVKTAGGATNVSFEGIRCVSHETRLYATGRTDRTWSTSRVAEWRRIVDKPVNRQHEALWRSYFCRVGVPIRDAADGSAVLRSGGHPPAN